MSQPTAWVFPGQGSQVVGMGKVLAEKYPEAAAIYQEADAILGFSLSNLCFNGPEEILTRTDNAQPAILVTSLVHLKILQTRFPALLGSKPLFTAGHSLGEYTALVASGALSFADAVRLVRERGRLMNEAGQGTSGMVAIIGGDDNVLEEICAQTGTEIANYNSPGQTAVSGTNENLAQFTEVAKAYGIKRVIPLAVSAAFHSSLMRPMAAELGKLIASINFKPAKPPIVSNVTAKPLQTAGVIMDELVLQTYSPVRWVESAQTMSQNGVTRFIEIGTGKVLTGLIKRIAKDAALVNSEDLLK